MSEFLQELAIHRGTPSPGGNPNQFIELIGGQEILYLFYEPDPIITREPYYYNTRTNVLYKKTVAINPVNAVKTYYWKQVSTC